MTKDQFIELAIEMANRQTTAESGMHPEYAKKALVAGMGKYVTARIYNDLKEGGDKDIELSLCNRFFVTPIWDETIKRHYAELKAKVVKLPKDRGLQYVGPKVGQENMYTIMRGITQEMITDDYVMQFTSSVFVRLDGPKRIQFKNLTSVCEVMVIMVADVDDLDGDDELMCPAEFEADVLNYMVEIIVGKKKLPDDVKPDNNEDK